MNQKTNVEQAAENAIEKAAEKLVAKAVLDKQEAAKKQAEQAEINRPIHLQPTVVGLRGGWGACG